MDIVGYCHIRSSPSTMRGAKDSSLFENKSCAVIEFDSEGGALVLSENGTCLASFDKEDILARFECSIIGGVICPPNMNHIDAWIYVSKCTQRKGGYTNILRMMVIQNSLRKGIFSDSFIWQKQ